MTTFPRGNRIWLFAIGVSVLLHALLLLFVPDFDRKNRPQLEMAVRLVERRAVKTQPAVKEKTKKTETAKKEKITVKKDKQIVYNKKAETAETDEISVNAPVQENNAVTKEPVAQSKTERNQIADINSLVITKKVEPNYPAFSRKRGEQGTAYLLISIDNGAVVSCKIEQTSGFARLDEAAKRAAMQWKFSNTGKILARVPISFRITE